jgi:hypothetical protein
MSKMSAEEIAYLFKMDSTYQRHAQGHFFEAMKSGYIGESAGKRAGEFPGSNILEYSFNDWKVVDSYIVSPISTHSGGTTTIYYGEIPIWMMQYLGWYQKEAIPCLKTALRQSYVAGHYHGGRGPVTHLHEGYLYSNQVRENDFWNRTVGQETIFSPQGIDVGQHIYQAMWLIDK